MRAVVQRVLRAAVAVNGAAVSEIGPGLLVLVGLGKGDTEADVRWMAGKVANLRIFEDQAGKMNRSVLEGSKAILAVSQFTLYGDARQGRRPSFIDALEPDRARPLYERFCAECRALGLLVGEGVFAADMQVSLVNDGPVTIWLESEPKPAAAP